VNRNTLQLLMKVIEIPQTIQEELTINQFTQNDSVRIVTQNQWSA